MNYRNSGKNLLTDDSTKHSWPNGKCGLTGKTLQVRLTVFPWQQTPKFQRQIRRVGSVSSECEFVHAVSETSSTDTTDTHYYFHKSQLFWPRFQSGPISESLSVSLYVCFLSSGKTHALAGSGWILSGYSSPNGRWKGTQALTVRHFFTVALWDLPVKCKVLYK